MKHGRGRACNDAQVDGMSSKFIFHPQWHPAVVGERDIILGSEWQCRTLIRQQLNDEDGETHFEEIGLYDQEAGEILSGEDRSLSIMPIEQWRSHDKDRLWFMMNGPHVMAWYVENEQYYEEYAWLSIRRNREYVWGAEQMFCDICRYMPVCLNIEWPSNFEYRCLSASIVCVWFGVDWLGVVDQIVQAGNLIHDAKNLGEYRRQHWGISQERWLSTNCLKQRVSQPVWLFSRERNTEPHTNRNNATLDPKTT